MSKNVLRKISEKLFSKKWRVLCHITKKNIFFKANLRNFLKTHLHLIKIGKRSINVYECVKEIFVRENYLLCYRNNILFSPTHKNIKNTYYFMLMRMYLTTRSSKVKKKK